MSTSDTPRTEKHRNYSNPDLPEEVVAWNFARTLERELNAALADGKEQARLLGKSAELELALLARIEELERKQ